MAKKSKIQEVKKVKATDESSIEKKTSDKKVVAKKPVNSSKAAVKKVATAAPKSSSVSKTGSKKDSTKEKVSAKKSSPSKAGASSTANKKTTSVKTKEKDKSIDSEENEVVPVEELDTIAKELLEKEERLARRKQNQEKKNAPQTIKTIPSVKISAASTDLTLPEHFRNGGKEKFEMEFQVRSSIKILFNFICSPSGLSEWFSDNVNIQNDVFIFQWEGSEEEARLIAIKEFELVRFKWLHSDDDDTYFELKIKVEELTGDVAIVITDFAFKDELQEAQLLWDTQIQNLLKALGSA